MRGQVRRRAVGAGDGQRAIERWARIGLERFSVVGLLGRIWELRENLSGYDAAYVAVAEALGTPLLTADARLARAPGPRCPMLVVRA